MSESDQDKRGTDRWWNDVVGDEVTLQVEGIEVTIAVEMAEQTERYHDGKSFVELVSSDGTLSLPEDTLAEAILDD